MGLGHEVNISDLPEKTQGKIQDLDKNTFEIYSLRTNIAMHLGTELKKYLPNDADGKRISLTEFVEAVENGSKIEDLVNWGDLAKRDDIEAELKKEEIISRFEIVIDSKIRLELLGAAISGSKTTAESTEMERFYRYEYGKLMEVAVKAGVIENEIARYTDMLGKIKERASQGLDVSVVVDLTNKLKERMEDLALRRNELVQTTEGYLYIYGDRLNEMKQGFEKSGRIVETPYVRKKAEEIAGYLAEGKAVFIHGELGGGKTELAKYVARSFVKDKLATWELENPKPTNKKALETWERKRQQETEPILVSGQKGTSEGELVGERTITRGETLLPEVQVEIIRQKCHEFEQSVLINKTGNDLLTAQREFTTLTQPLLIEAYREYFKAPIEVQVALGAIYKAMKEGRVAIIDEVNAIPHHILILLNDLLLKKVGDVVIPFIPGAEAFEVKKFYGLLATGNYKPEDGRAYIGRQPMDAAFISRFELVAYDYLPNNRGLEPEGLDDEQKRAWRSENELLQMVVTRLLRKDLTAILPEDAFDKLERLSYVARVLQDAFSGKTVPTAFNGRSRSGAEIAPQDVLKENVLSVRHLLPLIDKWRNDGFTKPLDVYLFDNYVKRSGARPEEKVFLYNTLQTQGDFFRVNYGWPAGTDINAILNLEYASDLFTNRAVQNLKMFTQKEVIEHVFGPAPKRETVSSIFTEDVATDGKFSEERIEEERRMEEWGRRGDLAFNPDRLKLR